MKKRHALSHNNKGLTLIEVIVSLGILGMILVPTLALFGGSLTNTRFTQESIDNKYLAEKYMEIVKATPLSGLLKALEDDMIVIDESGEEDEENVEDIDVGEDPVENSVDIYDLIATNTGIQLKNGVTITLKEIPEYKTMSVNNSFDFGESPKERILDIGSNNFEITATMSGADISISGIATSYTVANVNAESYAFKVRLPENYISTQIITITNKIISKKLEFYCVNENADGTYHDNRKLPEFIIKEGQVSYHDFTVTPEAKRLADEYEDLFIDSEQLTLAYTVTVTVANEKGRYEIESIKAINK